MQYVLTEDELRKHVPAAEHEKLKKALEWVRKRFAPHCTFTGRSDAYSHCGECPLGALDDSGPPEGLLVCFHRKSYSVKETE